MRLRTPLGRVRGLGSARAGTGHFLRQRLSALANLVLGVIVIGVMLALVGAGYTETLETLGSPFVASPMILFVLSATYHMMLGMQVIIEDYIHHEGLKIAALAANIGVAALVGASCVVALIGIVTASAGLYS